MAAPKYSFQNDCNTGFYRSGGDKIKISTTSKIFSPENLHSGEWFIKQAKDTARLATWQAVPIVLAGGGLLWLGLKLILKIMS